MGCGGSKSNSNSNSNSIDQSNVNQVPGSPARSPPRSPVGRAGNESPTDLNYTPTVVHHSPKQENKVDEKDIEIEGYLLKASPFASVGWHPRYFKLSDNNILEYYATKKDCELKRNIKGEINVKDIIGGTIIIAEHNLTFDVKNNEKSENQSTKTYELDCSTDANAIEWKNAIESHLSL